MTYIIPPQSTKQHSQTNKSDNTGTIYQSKNINLDEPGVIKLAQSTYCLMTEDDDIDFDTADAMYPMDGNIFINSNEVFSGSIGTSVLTNRSTDTGVPTPNVEEDVVWFNGAEVVSDGANIYYRSASTTWTAVSMSGFTTSNPTAMCVFGAENSLAVGNSNRVKFVNTSWAVNGTILILPNEYQVSSLSSVGTTLYIFTRSTSGGEAKVFTANTISATADYMFGCGTFEIFASTPYKDSVAIINSLGQVMRFNGGGFDELASLPVYVTEIEWADALNDYSGVANRGFVADGDLLYINVSSFTTDNIFRMLPGFHSGIWCYDDTIESLYHRYSPTYSRIITLDGSVITVNATNNNFTLTSGTLNTISTGMPMSYSRQAGTSIPELKDSQLYYIIKDSSTVFRIASSYANAVAGTPIDITGTGSASQEFYVHRTNDYGWSLYNNRGALAVLNSTIFNSTVAGRLAMTAQLSTKQDITTEVTVLNGISPYLPNWGYFVTPRLEATEIEDVWNKIYYKHKPLKSDDRIIIKYKQLETDGFPRSSVKYDDTTNWIGTWTDTDTFTTTSDLTSVTQGDEIELIGGVGAGYMAHVSSISYNAGTWTVNLDEGFPFAVSGDEFWFVSDKWIKLDTITSTSKTNAKSFFEKGLTGRSGFIMFKVLMIGTNVAIREQILSHGTDKPII